MKLNYMTQIILNCIDNEVHDQAVSEMDTVCALAYINQHIVKEYHLLNGCVSAHGENK